MSFGSGELDPSQPVGGGGSQVRTAPSNQVTFSRRELNRILDLYGRKVAAGEWRGSPDPSTSRGGRGCRLLVGRHSSPAGSMRPKVEAACRFAAATGKTAAIGALADIAASFAVTKHARERAVRGKISADAFL